MFREATALVIGWTALIVGTVGILGAVGYGAGYVLAFLTEGGIGETFKQVFRVLAIGLLVPLLLAAWLVGILSGLVVWACEGLRLAFRCGYEQVRGDD